MERIFEDLRERDIDCLLIEEFNVNYEFTKIVFSNNIKELNNIRKVVAKHSVVDLQYGETDIFLEIYTDTQLIVLLIENKIDASFQPQQSERYNIRKNNILKENKNIKAYTILIAPEKYISGHLESLKFDYSVTYENILNYFNKSNTKRDIYKANILKIAIDQAKRGYTIKEDIRVTKFWKNYWNYLQDNYPKIIMKEPGIKPFDADWPLFYFNWLPKNWEIHHKLSRGCIDIRTTLNQNEALKFENVNNEILVAKTGKSYSIRINVPKIDRLNDFYIQINEINICFEKLKLFENIKTICNVV